MRDLWLHARLMSLKSTIAFSTLMWKLPQGQQRTAEFQLTMDDVAREAASRARCMHTALNIYCLRLGYTVY